MTGVYEYLLSRSRLGLVQEGLDLQPILNRDWMTRRTGTIMPPGPSTERYTYEWSLGMEGLYYSVDVVWAPHMPWLVRTIPVEQQVHRSRSVTAAAPQLQPAELTHRVNSVVKNLPSYGRSKPSPTQLRRLYETVLGVTAKYFHYSSEWKNEYVNEHSGSSMGEGINWARAREVTDNQWLDILSIHRDNVQRMIDHPGWSNDLKFFTGIRSRTDELPGFKNHYSGLLTRSRIIGFHPALSQWTLFIPQKAAWYEEILRESEKILNVQGEFHYPFVEGGKIYQYFSDQLGTNKRFQAYDGKSWEASIGTILGPDFYPFLMKTGPIYQLPSGITVTSLLDTIASVATVRAHKGTFIVLGDDVNYFGGENLATPFEEFQPADTKMQSFLGVSYVYDRLKPRITGLKITQDNAAKRLRLAVDQSVHEEEFELERDARDRVVHAGLYLGEVGDGTLLSAFNTLPANKTGSPQANIELVTGDYRRKGFKAFRWAEQLGVDKLFKTISGAP